MSNTIEASILPPWHALQVRPKHEDKVSLLLRYKGYEQYSPSYRPSARGNARTYPAKKLFPGYVFCRFFYDPQPGLVSGGAGVVTTPGVIRLLGGRPPIPVPENEIRAVRLALARDLHVEPCPYVHAGERYELEDGPLRGISGIVLSPNGSLRVILSVELLQRSVAVTIDPAWIGGHKFSLGAAIGQAKRDLARV